MSTEYNSMLIAKFYSTVYEEEMTDLLEEIAEIGDPVFLYPVYDAYKKNKKSFISHYYLLTLNSLNSNDVIQVALEIGENPETKIIDIAYVLDIFDKRKFYEQRAIDIALAGLSVFISEINTNEYNLYTIVSFLKNAGSLSNIESKLLSIFINDKFNTKSREYAFGKWLEIDPKKNLQIIIDKFGEIKQNDKLESLIARVICNWTGTKIEELKKVIEEIGGIKAKYIIKRAREKDEEKQQKITEEKQQVVQKQYSNADLVEKIITLRVKINDIAKSNENIGLYIFPPNEAIFLQLKTANDNATLMKSCVGLREIIQNLNNDLGSHGLSTEEIKTLLPDAAKEDYNKSLNKLFLYLNSKKFKVDNSIFGLKQLSQLVGLIGAHPVAEKDQLIKKLAAVNLDKAYREEEWAAIHQNLLEQYAKSLSMLLEAIK